MTAIDTITPVAASLVPRGELAVSEANRDASLRSLLGTDYDFAQESGLLDMFAYDPSTGTDGLLHVLMGELSQDSHGMTRVEGFHHEPSAQHVASKVLTDHLEGANNEHRRKYRQFPFEPYKAQVAIQGIEKRSGTFDEAGRAQSKRIDNGMFPKEYDALAVLQTIRQAYDNLDQNVDPNKDGAIVTTSIAPMLDGETLLPIRLVLDGETKKIITAMPLPKNSSFMKLTDTAIKKYLGL